MNKKCFCLFSEKLGKYLTIHDNGYDYLRVFESGDDALDHRNTVLKQEYRDTVDIKGIDDIENFLDGTQFPGCYMTCYDNKGNKENRIFKYKRVDNNG